MQKRLLNVFEAAEYLGVKPSTLYSWVAHDRISRVKMGSRLLFDLRDLDQLIERNKRVCPVPVGTELHPAA